MIEVGEYVRSEEGIIDKLENYENVKELENPHHLKLKKINSTLCFTDEELKRLKHSKNIVTLIQRKDILIIDAGFTMYMFPIELITEEKIFCTCKRLSINKSDIKNFVIIGGCFTGCKFTIVTKEQLERISYNDD